MAGEINFGLLNTGAPADIYNAFQAGLDDKRKRQQADAEFALKQRAQDMLNQHYNNEAQRVAMETERVRQKAAAQQKAVADEAANVQGAMQFLFPNQPKFDVIRTEDSEGAPDYQVMPAGYWSDMSEPKQSASEPIATQMPATPGAPVADKPAKPAFRPLVMDIERARQLGLNENQAGMIGSLLANEQTAKMGMNMLNTAFKQSLRPTPSERLPKEVQLFNWLQGQPQEVQDKFNATLARMHPATTINNNQIGAKDVAKDLASNVGNMADASKAGAVSGVSMMQNGNRILQALDSGQVIAGPGAKLRMFGTQLANVLGMGGDDALANTRAAIQGLASMTVDARGKMKGQGQVSDYEGRLLEKAASGNVDDMTAPEIRTIVGVNQRLAKQMWDAHQKFLTKMRADPNAQASYQYYVPDVEMPQAYAGKQATGKAKPPSQSGSGWKIERVE